MTYDQYGGSEKNWSYYFIYVCKSSCMTNVVLTITILTIELTTEYIIFLDYCNILFLNQDLYILPFRMHDECNVWKVWTENACNVQQMENIVFL